MPDHRLGGLFLSPCRRYNCYGLSKVIWWLQYTTAHFDAKRELDDHQPEHSQGLYATVAIASSPPNYSAKPEFQTEVDAVYHQPAHVDCAGMVGRKYGSARAPSLVLAAPLDPGSSPPMSARFGFSDYGVSVPLQMGEGGVRGVLLDLSSTTHETLGDTRGWLAVVGSGPEEALAVAKEKERSTDMIASDIIKSGLLAIPAPPCPIIIINMSGSDVREELESPRRRDIIMGSIPAIPV